MAKGKAIVLTVEPKGVFKEGIAGESVLPGSMVAIKAATEPVSGRHTFDAATTGGFGIAFNTGLLGDTNTTAVASGYRVNAYCPLSGDEMNVLFVASDGAQAIGDVVGPVGTDGKFAATGTGWIVLETITVGASPADGTLVHCMKL